MKDVELLENELRCSHCGCIYHIASGCIYHIASGCWYNEPVSDEPDLLQKQIEQAKFDNEFAHKCLNVWITLTEDDKESYYHGNGTIGFIDNVIRLYNIDTKKVDERTILLTCDFNS